MRRTIKAATIFLLFFSSVAYSQQPDQSHQAWVNYMYNQVSAKSPEYLGYLDMINRAYENQSSLTDRPDATSSFNIGATARDLYNRQANPDVVPGSDGPLFNIASSFIPGADAVVGLLQLSNRDGFDQYVEFLNSARPYEKTVKIATAFTNNSYLDWSEEKGKEVLLRFRMYSMKDPKFNDQANKFILSVSNGVEVGSPYERVKEQESLEMGPYYRALNTRLVDSYLEELGKFDVNLDPDQFNTLRSQLDQRYVEITVEELYVLFDSLVNTIQKEKLDQAAARKFEYQLNEARGAVYIISTVIGWKDPETGYRLQQLGYGTINMIKAVEEFSAADGVSIAASANMLSAGLMIYSALQSKSGGANGFEYLAKLIEQMETRIITRLNGIDYKLDVIITILQRSFDTFRNDIRHVQIDLKVVKNFLLQNQELTLDIEYALNDYFSDIQTRNRFDILNRTIFHGQYVNRRPVSDDQFADGVQDLLKLCLLDSKDNIALGSSVDLRQTPVVIDRLTTYPAEKNIALLRDIARTYDFRISMDVANPEELNNSTLLLISYMQDWPEHFKDVNAKSFADPLRLCKDTDDFLSRLDSSFIMNKFYTQRQYFGDSLIKLRSAMQEAGTHEEELLSRQLQYRGRFQTLTEFNESRGFPIVFDQKKGNDMNKLMDETTHKTLHDWCIPKKVSSFSTYFPEYKNDWLTWSNATLSNQLDPLEQDSIQRLTPFYYRNSGITSQLKYLHTTETFIHHIATTTKILQIFKGKPSLLQNRPVGSGRQFTIAGGPYHTEGEDVGLVVRESKSNISGKPRQTSTYTLYDSDNQRTDQIAFVNTGYRNARVYYDDSQPFSDIYLPRTKAENELNMQLQDNFIKPVEDKFAQAVGESIIGTGQLQQLRRLVEHEQLMVETLREFVQLAHGQMIRENVPLASLLFSDSIYVARNAFMTYRLSKTTDFKELQDKIIDDFNRVRDKLAVALGQSTSIGNRQLKIQIGRLTVLKGLQARNGEIISSMKAAERNINAFLVKKFGPKKNAQN